MTPSILTIAQEGLRLAEKATPDSWLSDNRINLERHAATHHADICRELLRLHAVVKEAVAAFQRYGVHPNNELEMCGVHNGAACDCGLFAKNKRFIAALAQAGEEKT